LNLSLQKCHEILRVIAIPNVVVILSDKKTWVFVYITQNVYCSYPRIQKVQSLNVHIKWIVSSKSNIWI
jgi:hypothetical protein